MSVALVLWPRPVPLPCPIWDENIPISADATSFSKDIAPGFGLSVSSTTYLASGILTLRVGKPGHYVDKAGQMNTWVSIDDDSPNGKRWFFTVTEAVTNRVRATVCQLPPAGPLTTPK